MHQKIPFPLYVAVNLLGRLPWRRRYLSLLGPRVTNAAAVLPVGKVAFLLASALGRARPDLVAPLLAPDLCASLYKATSNEVRLRLDRFLIQAQKAQEEAIRTAMRNDSTLAEQLMRQGPESDWGKLLPEHPQMRYEDLFPEDVLGFPTAKVWKTSLPYQAALAAVQTRVVAGLVLGEQWATPAGQILEAAVSESRATREDAAASGVDFGPVWERVEDVEGDAEQIAMAWQSLGNTGADSTV